MTLSPKRQAMTPRRRAVIFASTDGLCAICANALKPGWHADHVIALAWGGAETFENLRPLCIPCHRDVTRAQAPKTAKIRRLILKSDPATRHRSNLQGRPFSRTPTRHVDGSVSPRTQPQKDLTP